MAPVAAEVGQAQDRDERRLSIVDPDPVSGHRPLQGLTQFACGRRVRPGQEHQHVHLNGYVRRIRIFARVDALI